MVNALSFSVSPKIAGALIVPAIFVLRGDNINIVEKKLKEIKPYEKMQERMIML